MSKAKQSKSPREERSYGTSWWCNACKTGEMTHEDFIQHLLLAHDIKPPVKGTKHLKMHMDGTDWFSSTYEWTINGLSFTQATCCKRKGRFGYE